MFFKFTCFLRGIEYHRTQSNARIRINQKAIRHILHYLEKLINEQDQNSKHIKASSLYSAWPVASIAVLFAFPPFALIRPRLEKHHSLPPSVPPVHSNSPWPCPPATPALQQPSLQQPYSPFTLFLSKILKRGEGGCVPTSFFPLFRLSPHHHPLPPRPPPTAPAVFLPSGCSRRWR